MSEQPGTPPQVVARMDQAFAAADEYLDMLMKIYRDAAGETSELQATGMLVAIARTQERGVLEGMLAAAVRRLARGQPPSPG